MQSAEVQVPALYCVTLDKSLYLSVCFCIEKGGKCLPHWPSWDNVHVFVLGIAKCTTHIIKKTQSLADQKYGKTTQFLFSDPASPSQVSQAVLAAPLLWRELSLHIRDRCEIFCNCSYLQTMQTA